MDPSRAAAGVEAPTPVVTETVTAPACAASGAGSTGGGALGPRANDEALLAHALRGDARAATALAAGLRPIIEARVARVLARRRARCPRGDRDDLAQEVFVQLLAHDSQKLRAWDPARGLSLASFVGLLAEREVIDVLRSERRAPTSRRFEPCGDAARVGELARAVSTSSEAQRHLDRDLAARLCARLHAWLSPRGRELFELLYLDEEPPAVVARRFAMPPSALYAWRTRVSHRARSLLAELAPDAASPRALAPRPPGGDAPVPQADAPNARLVPSKRARRGC